MYGIVRYSFWIVAAVCVAAFIGEPALGQVLTRPQVPDGSIRVAPNGDLFVTDTMSNAVRVLRVSPAAHGLSATKFSRRD